MPTQLEIVKMWTEDCLHNDVSLMPDMMAAENFRIEPLQHKYDIILAAERNRLSEMKIQYKTLLAEKTEFYLHGGNEITRAKGWIYPAKGKVLKQELEFYIPQDKDLVEEQLKIGYQENKIKYIESILEAIKQRRWLLKNVNDTRRYNSGG